MNYIDPLSTLNKNQKLAVLVYLMYLKEKMAGVLKGRSCAGGRKQRETMVKSEASSPIAAIESVLLTSAKDDLEECAVCITVVPGAYLNADMEKLVRARLKGQMAELLVRVNLEL